MLLKSLIKIGNELIKKYPPDAECWVDDEKVMVVYEGEKKIYDVEELLFGKLENDVEINFEGISAVRSWIKGNKKRIYFKAVGVPESAYRSGKVFLELVNGIWVPNMRYALMQDFANRLNSANLFDSEEIENKYQEYINS